MATVNAAIAASVEEVPSKKLPCYHCDQTGMPLHYNSSFAHIVDGVHVNKDFGLCTSCYTDGTFFYYYCPDCRAPYKANKAWLEAIGATHWRNAPCPKHSVTKESPTVKCAHCGKAGEAYKSQIAPDGKWYIYPHYGGLVSCHANWCGIAVHPEAKSTIIKGNHAYCSETCALVPKRPPGLWPTWSPLTWDYKLGCPCIACRALAGKSSKWPKIKVLVLESVSCSACGLDIPKQYAYSAGDNYACHTCVQKSFTTCKKCKQPRAKHEYQYGIIGYNGPKPVCATCLTAAEFTLCTAKCKAWYPPSESCECDGINEYNYKPIIHPSQFMWGSHESSKCRDRIPLIGLEIEVEAQVGKASRQAGAKLVRELLGNWTYLVHDGSLLGTKQHHPMGSEYGMVGGDKGFEIVTLPFSYDWFNENWHVFEGLMHTLTAKGYRAWEGGRCGLHIHISRRPMTDLHQMKFIRFILGSSNLCISVGQRDYTDKNLAKYAPFEADRRYKLIDKVRAHTNPGVEHHYTALNTNKEHTIEARWFRGTLNPASFRKNVEFIHSVWYFTKMFGFRSANEYNYVDWLRQTPQAKDYATVLAWIEEHYISRPWNLGRSGVSGRRSV